MRRWWRRNRVSEDIATEVDNGNIALAVPWWERLITVVLWITVGTFLLVTFTAVIVPDVFPVWFGVQAVEVTDPNVRHYTPQRTLWDWFGLIAIPLAIVLVGYILNRSDRAHERRLQDQRIEESRDIEEKRLAESQRIEEKRLYDARAIERERAQDAIVKDYLDEMTDLLLNHGLRGSPEGDEVRSVARARTLTALRGLDGSRKATIVQFLYESRLVGYFNDEDFVDVVIQMHKSDLSGISLGTTDFSGAMLSGVNLALADLTEANLEQAYLFRADLSGAKLFRAKLSGANLDIASLRGAMLNRADLSGANLELANLSGAILEGAHLFLAQLNRANLEQVSLRGAFLHGANFEQANLANAGLIGTNLTGVNLTETNLTDCPGLTSDQLLRAESLHGAILPNYIDPADLGDKWSLPKGEKRQS